MASTCFGSIKGTVLRVTRLDACGSPVTGAGNAIVSDGFISVAISPQYDEGDEFLQKTANGDLCVNEIDDPRLKRVNLDVEFCKVNPNLYDLINGAARTLMDGANPVGAAFGESANSSRFALEVWSKVPGACGPEGQQYVYWVFPDVGRSMVGDTTIENGVATFPFTATTFGASSDWGNGPYTPSPLPSGETIEEGEHWGFCITTTAVPTAACDPVSV
jgi:hypothetical protein